MARKALRARNACQPVPLVTAFKIIVLWHQGCYDAAYYVLRGANASSHGSDPTMSGRASRARGPATACGAPGTENAPAFGDDTAGAAFPGRRQARLMDEEAFKVGSTLVIDSEIEKSIEPPEARGLRHHRNIGRRLQAAGEQARDDVIEKPVERESAKATTRKELEQGETDRRKAEPEREKSASPGGSMLPLRLPLRTSDRFHSAVPLGLLPAYDVSAGAHHEHFHRQQYNMLERLQRLRGL